MTTYQQQAADFLAKHNIQFSAKLANTKLPTWKESDTRKNNHFVVTLKSTTLARAENKASLDFFDSENNFRDGKKELDAYSVLACISSDINCPDTLADFCSEYGYDEDSRKVEKTFRACVKQSNKLRKFFTTDEELADLAEIQ